MGPTPTRARRLRLLAIVSALIAAAGAASGALSQADAGPPPECASRQVATFAAGGADSPRTPGRVLVRFGGRFACPDGAEWFFEYGTTAAYGERTASNDAAVPVIESSGTATVRTDVDGLEYGQTYHYRLVVRYPDGEVQTGGDTVVTVRPGALRPPQRVSFSWTTPPTPRRTKLDEVKVLDAPAGATLTVSCDGPGSELCKPFERRIAIEDRPTVFRDWSVSPPGHLRVVVGGKGVSTEARILPRRDRGPRLETFCSGFPVALNTPCLSVALKSRGPQVRGLALSDLVRGTDVDIACRGPGCPPRDLSLSIGRPAGGLYRDLVLRRFDRLRPGAELTVLVTRPPTYGVKRTFRVTEEKVVGGSYRCLAPTGPSVTVRCPTAAPVTTGRG